MNDWLDAYLFLEDYVCVNKEALDLAFSLCGRSMETACNILNYYIGYKNFDQYMEETYEDD